MALTFDAPAITRVLLADGWHDVKDGSFVVRGFVLKDSDDQPCWEMGQTAYWKDGERSVVLAPISSVLAIK